MRFEELFERRQRRTLTMAEAAEILVGTARTFRRWRGRDATEGTVGLQDQQIGRVSARAEPLDKVLRFGYACDRFIRLKCPPNQDASVAGEVLCT